ncbi:hypothetical protein BTHE_0432 [Bifidobacterium thermophilum]|nr:hypothetical protein BTHE_0432 [Bifidobacterium thermophilum]
MEYIEMAPMIGGGREGYTLYSTVCHGYGYGSVTTWGGGRMSGMSPAMGHVVVKLEQQGYTVTGINRNKTVTCPCGEGGGHSISLTYDKRQGAVYPASDGDMCRYRDDTTALLKAWDFTPDDLWNDGAWNKGGTPRHDLPDKPGTVRKAEDREHHAAALADTGGCRRPLTGHARIRRLAGYAGNG